MSAISGPRLVVTSPQGASEPLKNMLVEIRISLWKPDNYIGSALIFQVLTSIECSGQPDQLQKFSKAKMKQMTIMSCSTSKLPSLTP